MPKPISVDGGTFKVRVTDDGAFRATVGGDDVEADTYAELREKLTKLTRRAKVRLALPVTLLGVTNAPDPKPRRNWETVAPLREAASTVDATITGLHGQNGDMLLDLPDGVKLRHSGNSWGGGRQGRVARRLTSDEAAAYAQLQTDADAARDALNAFIDSVSIGNPKEWVEGEVIKAQRASADADPVEPTGDPRLDVPKRGYNQNDGKLAKRTTGR